VIWIGFRLLPLDGGVTVLICAGFCGLGVWLVCALSGAGLVEVSGAPAPLYVTLAIAARAFCELCRSPGPSYW
jgi:hypothetical protein